MTELAALTVALGAAMSATLVGVVMAAGLGRLDRHADHRGQGLPVAGTRVRRHLGRFGSAD
jgi:hypothetical protein